MEYYYIMYDPWSQTPQSTDKNGVLHYPVIFVFIHIYPILAWYLEGHRCIKLRSAKTLGF
jgi:hypothetical protein